MLSCKKATSLVEKKSLLGLSKKEELRLWLHASMCEGCAAYQKQSLIIDSLLEKQLTTAHNLSTMPELENKELKEHIIAKIKEK